MGAYENIGLREVLSGALIVRVEGQGTGTGEPGQVRMACEGTQQSRDRVEIHRADRPCVLRVLWHLSLRPHAETDVRHGAQYNHGLGLSTTMGWGSVQPRAGGVQGSADTLGPWAQ